MRIAKETLESLASKGIIVSPFPSDEAQEKWIENYKEDYEKYNRYRSAVCIDSEWKYSDEIPDWQERMESSLQEELTRTNRCWGLWYNSDTVYIREGDILVKRSVGKNKLLDEETILKALERDKKAYNSKYGQFAKDVQKLFASKFGGNLGHIYPTTYGIGVWVFYNFKADECVDSVRKVLDEMNVTYTNEFSEAHYVYRFKISKEKVNRAKLQAA